MTSNRGRQKSLEKKKKRREAARSRAATSRAASSPAAVVALAATCPFGPVFMTGAWRHADEADPALVGVILTRQLPDRSYVVQSCLVDRVCLGVKDAFVLTSQTEEDLDELLDRYEEAHEDGVEEVDVLEAQSVIYHAIDFARAVGFAPHPDFDGALVGPRPERLLDTPLAHPTQPFYVPGPHDDVAGIRRVLDRYWAEEAEVAGAEGTPAALHMAIELWRDSFTARHPAELKTGFAEYLHAILGRAFDPERDQEAIAPHLTSLPELWIACFRPTADGRTGCALARSFPPLRGAVMSDAVERVAGARVLFGDVVALNRRTNVATVRDAFDGASYPLVLDRPTARAVTRWTRLFGVVVALADGTLYPPSTLLAHAWLRNVAPSTLIAGVNELLARFGHGEVVDEASPQSSLARWAGLAHGVLHRAIGPTEAQAKALARRKFVVNTDGERFEMHEATLALDAATERALAMALGSSDDFVLGPEGYRMFGAPPSRSSRSSVTVFENESLATVLPERPGEWLVTANSALRYARVLERLAALAGHDLRVTALETMRPWESQPELASEESADTDRVVMSSSPIEAPTKRAAKTAMRQHVKDAPLRALDEHVPAVGGAPREVVTTPDGRARVELWLEEWELHGSGDREGWAFLDLDPVRVELGLPRVVTPVRASATRSSRSPRV